MMHQSRGSGQLLTDGSELPSGAGLLQRGGAGQCTGFAQQRFPIVVEVQPGAALGHQPLMPGGLYPAVVDDKVGGVQVDTDLPADQMYRHRVSVRADGDLAEPVDPRGQPGPGLEQFLGQQRPLDGELFPDGVDAGADARRASSAASHASTMALSSSREETCGTGTRWLRRNQPICPSTPPFSCSPPSPGWQ